jgi:hypothetical protein
MQYPLQTSSQMSPATATRFHPFASAGSKPNLSPGAGGAPYTASPTKRNFAGDILEKALLTGPKTRISPANFIWRRVATQLFP